MNGLSPLIRRGFFVSGIAALAGAAFYAGALVGPRGAAGTGTAPVGGRTSGPAARVGDAGSMFRNRFSVVDDPFAGTESVLLTPRPRADECLDGCPFSLRTVDARKGADACRQVLKSLRGHVSDLCRVAAIVHPDFARELELAIAREERLAASDGAFGEGTPGLRVLFIAMPRPDLGTNLFAVGVAVYDHRDPKFDEHRATPSPGGRRISITRIERRVAGEDRAELVAGDVSVHEVVPAAAVPPMTDAMRTILASRELERHFEGVATLQHGLHLEPDGSLVAYGQDLSPFPLRKNPELEEALRALLERP